MIRSTVLAIASSIALLPIPAEAQELVSNGGFESGSFAGWNHFGNTAWADIVQPGFEGSYAAQFGPVGSLGGISQMLDLSVGQTYDFSFMLVSGVSDPGLTFFSADLGGTSLVTLDDQPAFGWTTYSFSFTATQAQNLLSFTFRQDPSFFRLDSVSVQASAAVPEPATWGMMIGGFGLVGGSLRASRSKRKDSAPALA